MFSAKNAQKNALVYEITNFFGKSCQKMVKIVKKKKVKKIEYFLIRFFWIGQDPPPILTESKKNSFFMPPLISLITIEKPSSPKVSY